jgi:hypothetical protein
MYTKEYYKSAVLKIPILPVSNRVLRDFFLRIAGILFAAIHLGGKPPSFLRGAVNKVVKKFSFVQSLLRNV